MGKRALVCLTGMGMIAQHEQLAVHWPSVCIPLRAAVGAATPVAEDLYSDTACFVAGACQQLLFDAMKGTRS